MAGLIKKVNGLALSEDVVDQPPKKVERFDQPLINVRGPFSSFVS